MHESHSGFPVPTAPSARPTYRVLWIIAALLGVIAVQLAIRDSQPTWLPRALGQIDPRLGSRGIHAFTGQLDRNTYGLFMLDVDTGTVWCYEFSGQSAKDRKMQLVAGRLWVYDRYLENFNQAEPTPDQVAALIEQVRQEKLSGSAADTSTDRNTPGQSPGS